MITHRIIAWSLIVLMPFFFIEGVYAGQPSHTQEVIRCMREVTCGSPMRHISFDDDIRGFLLYVSSDVKTKDDVLLINNEWLAVRRVVENNGEDTTLILDYNLDGVIDAAQFAQEKNPLVYRRKSENMSKKEREELQNYFDSVITRAYLIKALSPNIKKP